MVLTGAQPYYVEAFPMTEYSMYRAVPLEHDQARPAGAAGGGAARAREAPRPDELHVRRPYVQRQAGNERSASPSNLDLIFLWDEAWSGFARFSPFLRPRTAMGAAADIEEWLRDPASVAAYEKQQEELGAETVR